ncbi:STAS domain-containing protein [Mycolicibacterium madagascariense]|nr:STAS domain-containing protein [Mycolicibacterium madagascariense]MCV7015035.1 STAS domain-containing protein [Mycolicibacterium madagascariense]
MNLEVTMPTDANPHAATLHVTGDLDYVTIGPVLDAVRTLLQERPDLQALHLDCAELDFCDSAGLSGLLAMHDMTETEEVLFHLDNRPSQLDRLLDLTGTTEYLLSDAAAADSSGLG